MASGSSKHYRHEGQPIQQSLPSATSKLTSRRKTQRRKHRYEKQLRFKEHSKLQQIIYTANKKCVRHYGFASSPTASKTMNFKQAIVKLSTNHNNNLQPTNLSYHNLCIMEKTPPGTRELLGLNLKYCLASATTDKDINKMVLQMANSIRTFHYLQANPKLQKSEYIKQIYIKNPTWKPPPAPLYIEDAITNFEIQLKWKATLVNHSNKKRAKSNLTHKQTQTLQALKQNKNIIIKPSDKNLGPAIMDTNHYIQQVLKEHLLTDTYRQLTQSEAHNKLACISDTLKTL